MERPLALNATGRMSRKNHKTSQLYQDSIHRKLATAEAALSAAMEDPHAVYLSDAPNPCILRLEIAALLKQLV
jgi:hypothetical protein